MFLKQKLIKLNISNSAVIMKKIRISVGIPAYNEEQNITALLDAIAKQRPRIAVIEKVFVIDDGSTDSTREKVESFMKSGKLRGKLQLICLKKRRGKWFAINTFLKIAKSPVLILESADNIPKEDCYEKMARHFLEGRMGIVGARVVPLNDRKTFFGFLAYLTYDLHHELALETPKFGELIMFRHYAVKYVRPTTVDEEEIARLIKKKGLILKYEPEAIVYNKAPETLPDFINQQKRNYCGHLILYNKYKYKAATLGNWGILKRLFKHLNCSDTPKLFAAVILELTARFLGFLNYKTRKSEDILWKPIKSVKNLRA